MSPFKLLLSSKVGRVAALFSAVSIASAAAWAGPTGDPEFPLAAGDVVKIDILDDEKEPTDQTIALNGSVQAPLVGSVQIAGLSVAQALDTLNRFYVEQHIFVAPRIGFSVVAYRPIFVFGDVRQSGTYPFQPGLSVEKAMALAGGQTTTDSVEDPVLARARLRGELEAAEATIIREALAYARLTAELAGRADVRPQDIPESARAFVSGPLAESILEVEQRIATASTEGFARRNRYSTSR